MKALLKMPVALLLAALARAVIRKYRPLVVMVTGSVGKTSTKDAVAAALAPRFFLRASEKSYNSEFGVPLTVFGSKNPWNSPAAWLRTIVGAFALVLFPNHYPKLLVLEVGADRPGDLARILRIAHPDAVVVTKLPDVPVHVEAYGGPQGVRDEEFSPAYALAPGAPLVICSDDPNAVTMAACTSARVSTFGFADGSTVLLEGYRYEDGGMRATVNIDGTQHELVAQGALGRPQLYAPAAALAVALALGVSRKDALAGVAQYGPPVGRGRILRGRNGSTLVDDTYNASPAAVEEALSALALLPAQRRIAVLGDMLELGRYSAEEHARIGGQAALRADLLVAVGTRAAGMRDAAVAAGLSDDSFHAFGTAVEAASWLAQEVRDGDAVLLKGSQGVRMERIVEALLLDPADRTLLVRQDKEWQVR